MSGAIGVRILRPDEDAAWTELLAASPQNNIYSSPDYLDALCAATGATRRVLGVFRGDGLQGGVALFERHSRAGRFVEPRLLLYYNGLVRRANATKYPSEATARDLEVDRAIVGALAAERYGRVQLKNVPSVTDVRTFLESGWTAKATYTYVVPLEDLAAQWSRVEQNLRRLIKRCGETGMTVAAEDDFDGFFELHRLTADRKGALLYLPADAFARFYAGLRQRDLARIFTARDASGRLAAAQLVLTGPHPGTHTVTAGTHPEFLKSGVTALLRWRVFELLAASGYRSNDLTDAALNPVTHFKAQLGGRLEVCFVLTSPSSLAFRIQDLRARVGQIARARLGRA